MNPRPPTESETRSGSDNGSTVAPIAGLMPEPIPEPPPTVAIDDLAAVIAKFRQFDAVAKQWAAARDEMRRQIEQRLANAEVGTIDNRPAVRWTYVTSRRLDRTLLKYHVPPLLLAECFTEQRTRRFTLVDDAEGGEAV